MITPVVPTKKSNPFQLRLSFPCEVALLPRLTLCVVAEQTLIFFNIRMYWKAYGEWPSKMLSKSGTWPPVGMYADKNLLTLEAALLYEATPHDDEALMKLGMPKVGVRIAVYNLKIIRIPQMMMDMAMAVLSAAGAPANFGRESLV